MNAPATPPKTLAEQVEARRAELDGLIALLQQERDAIRDRITDLRAEMDALPVQRARRKRQPKP